MRDYPPNYIPVEAMAITWLKRVAEQLMNHTGACDFVAVYPLIYLALLNNCTADPGLGWKTLFQKPHGTITLDISIIIRTNLF
jgi:hypothetical protein